MTAGAVLVEGQDLELNSEIDVADLDAVRDVEHGRCEVQYRGDAGLDQVVRCPRARALGWEPQLASLTRNVPSMPMPCIIRLAATRITPQNISSIDVT